MAAFLHQRVRILLRLAGQLKVRSTTQRRAGYCVSPGPVLTVVKQPAYELGSTAARLLLQRILHPTTPPPQEIVLPTEMVIRTSTAPPASNLRAK